MFFIFLKYLGLKLKLFKVRNENPMAYTTFAENFSQIGDLNFFGPQKTKGGTLWCFLGRKILGLRFG